MITCCKDCVAPKRHVGCHADCQEYIDEKKKHDEKKAEIDRKRHTNNAIDDHCIGTIIKQMKRKKLGIDDWCGIVSEGENNTICSLLKKSIDLGIEVDIKKKEDTNVSDKQAD